MPGARGGHRGPRPAQAGIRGDRTVPSVDLTDAGACRAALSPLRGITRIVYGTLFEKPELGKGWLEADQIATNAAMLCNLMDAVEPGDPGLRHISLLQGTKAYGVHLGQMPIPGKESAPRHIHPNFYWDTGGPDPRERQARAGWSSPSSGRRRWSASRSAVR